VYIYVYFVPFGVHFPGRRATGNPIPCSETSPTLPFVVGFVYLDLVLAMRAAEIVGLDLVVFNYETFPAFGAP
jgi:hypothetical protein